MATATKSTIWICPDWRSRLLGTILLGMLTITLFCDLLLACFSGWMNEPQYSHGFAVPLTALGLGWLSRHRFQPGTASSSSFGIAMIACGIAGHVLATYVDSEVTDGFSFLLTVLGITLLIWGRLAFTALWPAGLFLGFMLPIPRHIEHAFSDSLQTWGANESAWYIQIFGVPAIAQGNTILMGDTRLEVAEACSGIRMMMVFFAISTAAAIVSHRTLWEKLLILMSAPPIALVCNVMRIVTTAVAHHSYGHTTANPVLHELSGWLMIPLAMLMLFLELRLLDCLFVEAGNSRPGMTYHIPTPPFTVQTEKQ